MQYDLSGIMSILGCHTVYELLRYGVAPQLYKMAGKRYETGLNGDIFAKTRVVCSTIKKLKYCNIACFKMVIIKGTQRNDSFFNLIQ